jgi:hypothetical protein
MGNFTRIVTASLTVCAAFIAACDEHPTSPSSTIAGRYQYTAYNAGDSVVVIGSIALGNPDSTEFTGSWALATVGGAADVGPQTGVGTLRGSTASGVSINLNPNYVDNNVFLVGTSGEREISGTWQWITFAGITTQGRFEMKKR